MEAGSLTLDSLAYNRCLGSLAAAHMINFDQTRFRYEPSPIGVASNFFSPAVYDELTRNFPPASLYGPDPEVGRRLSFTRSRNARAFDAFFKSQPVWRELRSYVESREFLTRSLAMMASHGLDVGDDMVDSSIEQRALRFARGLKRGELRGWSARFRIDLNFVIMPADGGALLPHTDLPSKFANFAVSMTRPGEWDPALGGSTDIVWPEDPRDIFNRGTKRLAFDEVEVLERIAYLPNQAVIVVKTFNSWHSVGPMQTPGSPALRKTLNINLLRN